MPWRLRRNCGGKVPFGGFEPTVQAYVGELGDRIGVEFYTDFPPRRGTPPHHAEWRPGAPGVRLDGDFAKITIRLVRNTQTGKIQADET